MDGLLIIDKPADMTSHDVVARVRQILHVRRVGHTGTLDPFATGVLVVLVGRATRLAQFLSGAEKEYEAIIRLGFSTETGDMTGKPTSSSDTDAAQSTHLWTDQEIEAAFATLQGDIDQVPPMYSAKKQGGRKLYELARQGEKVEREPVRVHVHSFTTVRRGPVLLKDNSDGTFDLAAHVVCSAGTYVRALAESVGERLGIGAHLAELRRIRAGHFKISEAISLEQLKTAADEQALATVLLPPEVALRRMPHVDLKADDARRVRHGIAVPLEQYSGGPLCKGENVALWNEAGNLLAVACYDPESGTLQPRVVIAAEP